MALSNLAGWNETAVPASVCGAGDKNASEERVVPGMSGGERSQGRFLCR